MSEAKPWEYGTSHLPERGEAIEYGGRGEGPGRNRVHSHSMQSLLGSLGTVTFTPGEVGTSQVLFEEKTGLDLLQ